MYCLIVLPSASNTEHLGMYAMPYKLAETEEITWNETGEIAQQCNASKKKKYGNDELKSEKNITSMYTLQVWYELIWEVDCRIQNTLDHRNM